MQNEVKNDAVLLDNSFQLHSVVNILKCCQVK